MSKKKWIALFVCLQIITVLLSVSITCILVDKTLEKTLEGERGVGNLIMGKIVFIGAPIQDGNMEKCYIVYVQEKGKELLRTVLITPDTWLFDGQGGAIWEKCLNFDTSVNDYLKVGVEIKADVYAPDSTICDRHILLYPARTAEITNAPK